MEKVYFSVVWLSKVRGSVKQIVLIPAIDCTIMNDLILLRCQFDCLNFVALTARRQNIWR